MKTLLVFLLCSPIFAQDTLSSSTTELLFEYPPLRDSSGMITVDQVWNGLDINLDSYTRGSYKGGHRNRRFEACGCGMCQIINGVWKVALAWERKNLRSSLSARIAQDPKDSARKMLEIGQHVTPNEEMKHAIELLQIKKDVDIVGEYGSGIAKFAVMCAEAGALKAYGFEYNHEMYLKGKQYIQQAVDDGRIPSGSVEIEEIDVLKVHHAKYGITLGFVYLDPEMLVQMADLGVFTGLDKVVSPRHSIPLPGMTERQHGDVWLYTSDPADQPAYRSKFQLPPLMIADAAPQEPAVVEQSGEKKDTFDYSAWALFFHHKKGCPPCLAFEHNVKPKVEKFLTVKTVNERNSVAVGITRFPRFRLAHKNKYTGKWMYVHRGKKGQYVEWSGSIDPDTLRKTIKSLSHHFEDKGSPEITELRNGILLLDSVAIPELLQNAFDSPKTIWTNHDTHPPLQHTDHKTYLVGYNMAGNKELTKTGSPNNEKPWRHPGGCDSFASKLNGERCFYFPDLTEVWTEYRRVPSFSQTRVSGDSWGNTHRPAGRYPVGTVGAEFITTDGTLHAIRYRTKTEEGWYGEQIDVSPMPLGYIPVANCVDCHSDIGKHANEIDNTQEWYSHIRGLEKDGFFNSPFMTMTGSGTGQGHNSFVWDNIHLLQIID